METPLPTEYTVLEVSGIVSVELIEDIENIRGTVHFPNIILILGPTGAGKSTFIEALDSSKSLKISSNQLEGFTQSISLYGLRNVRRISHPIYLLDVPGFADTKISEMRIVSMLKDWLAKAGLTSLWHTLYLSPINTPRLPRSHRQVLRTFQALTGVSTARGITVVSTMWDCVWNETGRKRAESNFNQLRNDIWTEYVDNGTEILKFHNTQESALEILDRTLTRFAGPEFALVGITNPDTIIRETSFGFNLYADLEQRIQNLNMQITNMQSDLLGAAERDDTQLAAVLVPRLDEVQRLLAMFEQEMRELGLPPTDTGPSHLAKTLD